MKLRLPKDVNNEIQQERKKDIDEGTLLVGKITKIRQTYASEQQQLEDFRTHAIEEADKIKKELNDEIETKRTELKGLLEARTEAIKPLNLEWEKVESVVANLQSETEKLIQEKSVIATDKSELDTLRVNLNTKTSTLNKRELRLDAKETALTAREKDVAKKEDEINNRFTAVESHISESYRLLDARAATIGEQLVNLELREAYVKDKTGELDKREKSIKDKYETLQRTITRLNGK